MQDQPVLVTTEHRGVFYGYVPHGADLTGDTLRLDRARMCIYWSRDMKGVLGLAAMGPSATCKIGPRVPAITLRGVTSVTICTPAAAEAWEAAPWKA